MPVAPPAPVVGAAAATPANFVAPDWCAAPTGAAAGSHLLVWKGAALLESLAINVRPFYFAGRLPECDVMLEHASASRHHAAILHHRSGAVYIHDLGSAHGTFLSGRRLPPREPTLWAEGEPCVFGASSRTYVLRARPDAPLMPPRATGLGVASARPPSASSTSSASDASVGAEAAAAPPPRAQITGAACNEGGAASGGAMRGLSAIAGIAAPGGVPASDSSMAPRCPAVAVAARGGGEAAGGVDGAAWEAEGGMLHGMDGVTEANTRANVRIGPPAPAAGEGRGAMRSKAAERTGGRPRRSVTFDPQPPRVRYYEPASPEAIVDPEGAALEPAHAAHASHGGRVGSGAPLPKPRCEVSFTSARKRPLPGASVAGEDCEDAPTGQFAHLTEHSTVGAASAAVSLSSVPSRLAALYGSVAAADVDAGLAALASGEGGTARRAFPREREGAFLRRAAPLFASAGAPLSASAAEAAEAAEVAEAADVMLDVASLCAHTAVGSLVSDGVRLALQSTDGAALLELHWRQPEQNPIVRILRNPARRRARCPLPAHGAHADARACSPSTRLLPVCAARRRHHIVHAHAHAYASILIDCLRSHHAWLVCAFRSTGAYLCVIGAGRASYGAATWTVGGGRPADASASPPRCRAPPTLVTPRTGAGRPSQVTRRGPTAPSDRSRFPSST